MKFPNSFLFSGYKSESHSFLFKNAAGRAGLVVYCSIVCLVLIGVIFSNLVEVNYRVIWNGIAHKDAYEKALIEVEKIASSSTFTTEEKQIIAYGKANNYTKEEATDALTKYRTGQLVNKVSLSDTVIPIAVSLVAIIFAHIVLSLIFFKVIIDFIVLGSKDKTEN